MHLVPESVSRQDGCGAGIALEAACCKPLLLTLGITRILEQGSLDVSIWGSADKEHWQLLTAFPQKFYCGMYSLLLDLSRQPEVRYLRAQWKMSQWGHGDESLFGFYLRVEEAKLKTAGAG